MTIIKTALVQGVAEMYLQNTKDTYKWEKLRFFWSITAIDMTTIQLSVFSTSCLFSSLPLLLREYISQAEWMYNAEGAGQGVGSHTAHFMAVFQSSFLIFLPPECGFCCTLTGPLFRAILSLVNILHYFIKLQFSEPGYDTDGTLSKWTTWANACDRGVSGRLQGHSHGRTNAGLLPRAKTSITLFH